MKEPEEPRFIFLKTKISSSKELSDFLQSNNVDLIATENAVKYFEELQKYNFSQPQVRIDPDNEIVFEWQKNKKILVVLFSEKETYYGRVGKDNVMEENNLENPQQLYSFLSWLFNEQHQ